MKKRAVIICNGTLDTKYLYSNIRSSDFLVAVDGGSNKLVKTKFVPNVIIGDMDSISKNALKKFKDCEFIKFPKEKAEVDLELAIRYCLEKKFKEILILGAVGSRADMTFANMLSLSQIPTGTDAKIVHENQDIFISPKKLILEGVPGERISFIPLNGDVSGLGLKGFKYELEDYTLKFGLGVGVSNEFKKKKTSITFKDGVLLCVHFRKWF